MILRKAETSEKNDRIKTFEALCAELLWWQNEGAMGWHVNRESVDTIVVELKRNRNIRIYDEGGGVSYEVLEESVQIEQSGRPSDCGKTVSYQEACYFCLNMAAMENERFLIEVVAEEERRLKSRPWLTTLPAVKMFFRIVGCIFGLILMLFGAFMLFAIWYSFETETPFHVYLSLTFSFGVILFAGIALIVISVRKKRHMAGYYGEF